MIWIISIPLVLFLLGFLYYLYSNQEKSDFVAPDKNCARLSHGVTHYELSGTDSAPVIVLIHGGTIPMCVWDEQVRVFTKAGFRVLRYDQYGRGGSERLSKPYTRQLFSDQLYDLLNHLNINEPVHLLGPSFGGAISVLFAANHPSKVRSIVLISPVLNLLNSNSPLVKPIKFCSIPVIGDFIFRTIIKQKIINRGLELTPCPSCKTIFANQFYCKGTEFSFLSIFRNDVYGDYKNETILASHNVKNILLVRGKNDQEVTKNMIQQVRTNLPNCRFIELEDSGHSPFSKNENQEFIKILLDFYNDK